ncbi:hypothetical protein EOM27_03500 [Candidatus Saccharibacteria bacterium]|nr:hypothetical protein [Candidatus Saccharibacteria bacterium]
MSEDKGINSTSVESLGDKPSEGKNGKKFKIDFSWVKKHWALLVILVAVVAVAGAVVTINRLSQNGADQSSAEDEQILNMEPQTLEDKVLALVAKGDNAAADKMIEDEIEKESDTKKKTSLYVTKSISLSAQKRYEESIAVANLAIQTDESIRPMMILYLADIYVEIGDRDSGLRIVDEEIARLSGKDDTESLKRTLELKTKKGFIQNEN